MHRPAPTATAGSRRSLAAAILVTALGGSLLLSSGTSSSAAPAGAPAGPAAAGVRMGPAVPVPPVRPLLLTGPSPVLPVARSGAATGPSTAVPPRVGPAGPVGPGSSPHAVREVQRLLNAHGAGLRVDGAWGPATGRAVRGLQRRAGLPATGRVDAWTAAALRSGAA